ncbi:MAG: OmpA family protein [Candidatus Eisenbacteria bacterium]|nr:OmpA family protein [Candidatus Eisenbacteria bacterium]
MPVKDRRPPPEDSEEGAPAWVVTFGDMMSLLMVFFVLIVSFSTMDVIKYRSLVGSLKTAFGAKDASMIAGQVGQPSFVEMMNRRRFDTESVADVQEEIKKQNLEKQVSVSRSERGVVLRIRGRLLFDLGSAELRGEAGELLQKVSGVLREHPRTVLVEGHTDNLPISTVLYRSNWELSAARAAAVVRFLVEAAEFDPNRLAVLGLGETRPIKSNQTPKGRAQNRRVDFVLSKIPPGHGQVED